MFQKTILFFFTIIASFISYAQPREFTVQEFYDEFDEGSIANWSVINNTDNLYFLENGAYEMYRRNKQNADMVFCRWENPFDNFEIRMNFKFDKNKNNKEQYAGIIFKAGKTSALLAEIHQEGKVRIRKIVDKQVSFITGKPEESGWVKFKNIKKDYNYFTIQCDSNTYNLYLNGVKIYTQVETGFQPGRFGIVVGTDTKIKVDLIGVYSETKPFVDSSAAEIDTIPVPYVDPVTPVVTPVVTPDPTAQATITDDTTQKAVVPTPNPVVTVPTTNEEILALQKKVEELQLLVNQFRNKAFQEQDRADSMIAVVDGEGKREYREENKVLLIENKSLQKQNDSLKIAIRTYESIRSAIGKSEGSEISLLLAEKLKQEKSINDSLDRRNKELELQNKKLTLHIKSLEAQVKKLKAASKAAAEAAKRQAKNPMAQPPKKK
jgi:uncharacterized pyridoxamine 5'-phosphate oxidase family protein